MPQCHCPPKVGDYFYSDGTFSTEREASKTCIGIVFYVGQHENDGSDYSATGIGQAKCHGYAVAVQDAASNCIWGASAKKVGQHIMQRLITKTRLPHPLIQAVGFCPQSVRCGILTKNVLLCLMVKQEYQAFDGAGSTGHLRNTIKRRMTSFL